MSKVELVEIPVPEGDPQVIVVKDASIFNISAIAVVRWMYLALFLYSMLVSYLTECRWYAMILYYIVEYFCFYFWHWQAHHRVWWIPFNKACHQKHQEHHWHVYPPTDFYGQQCTASDSATHLTWLEYFHPMGWVSQHELLLYLLSCMSLVLSRLLFDASNGAIAGAVGGIFIMGFIGNYLHHSFHIPKHWLERYNWFHELRGLHFVHHKGTAKHNYGILNMSGDKLFGVFRFDTTTKSA